MRVPDDIALRRIDGQTGRFGDYAGQVVLTVNVASKCGLTPQYAELERFHRANQDRGFVVLGFPCNQFRGQEPGDEADIQAFCATTYDVTFPLFAKISVNGPERHPLYRVLLEGAPAAVENEGGLRDRLAQHGTVSPPGDVMWNFEKFLIGRNGDVIGRFAPDIGVDDERLAGAVDRALAG